jgi:hypothetical protein
MKKIILTIAFILGITNIANAQCPNGRCGPNFSGYYNGYGYSLGNESFSNGQNRLILPGGQTYMWYSNSYQPHLYPNFNYNYFYSLPYYNSYMRVW